MADFYLEFWSLSLNQEKSAAWQNELCRLATSWVNEERLIVHSDHLLRMKGEMVNEFKCAKERVTTKAGFKAEVEKCLDHLPVIRGDGELAYMAPLTRLLVPRSAVSVLNCSQNFPLTFEDIKGGDPRL